MADSETETPKYQSKLEQWNSSRWERFKYMVHGSFLGLCAGAIFSFVVPKDLIRQNKFLNHWIQPDNMTPNIYPAANSALFAWIGAIIGGTIDIIRGGRCQRPEEVSTLQPVSNTAILLQNESQEIADTNHNNKNNSFAQRIKQESPTLTTTSSSTPTL